MQFFIYVSSYIPSSLEFSTPFLTVLSNLLLQWVEEPTLLVTRFEYANLFHTITDWYSAYVSSRVTNLPNRPNVVFLDGHCKVCDALCTLLLVHFILFVAWVMSNKSVSSAITGVNNRRSHFCMLDLLFVSCNDNTAWWSSCFFLIYSAIFSSCLENNCNQKQFLIVTRSVSFFVLHFSQIAPPVIFLAASLDASSIFFVFLHCTHPWMYAWLPDYIFPPLCHFISDLAWLNMIFYC